MGSEYHEQHLKCSRCGGETFVVVKRVHLDGFADGLAADCVSCGRRRSGL